MATKLNDSVDGNEFRVLNKKYVQILQDAVKRHNVHFIYPQEMKIHFAVRQINKRLKELNNPLFMVKIVDSPQMNEITNWHHMPNYPERAYELIHEEPRTVGDNGFIFQSDIVEQKTLSKPDFEHTMNLLSNTKQEHVAAIKDVRNIDEVIVAIATYYSKKQLGPVKKRHTKRVSIHHSLLYFICALMRSILGVLRQAKIGCFS